MGALTDKQEIFCREYIRESNATRAAILAGYSADSAKSIGCENLTKPDVLARIKAIRQEEAKRWGISMERIVQEYAKLAFFDIKKVYDNTGRLKNIHDVDDDTAAAIISLESEEISSQGEYLGDAKKVKMSDKKAALDSLSKLLGLDPAAKSQLTGEGGSPLFPTAIALTLPDGMNVSFPDNTDGDESATDPAI